MQNNLDEFDQLRRLLALKRHEQPPPGYFHRFPGLVIARIRAGERVQDSGVLGQLFGEGSWLARFWGRLESQPIWAAAVGAACCALLLSGVVLSTEDAGTGATPYPAPSAMQASLGLGDRSSHSGGMGSAMLASFEMTNSFGGASAISSVFPAQPAVFNRILGN